MTTKSTYVYRCHHHCSIVADMSDSALDQAQYSHRRLHHTLYTFITSDITSNSNWWTIPNNWKFTEKISCNFLHNYDGDKSHCSISSIAYYYHH